MFILISSKNLRYIYGNRDRKKPRFTDETGMHIFIRKIATENRRQATWTRVDACPV